MLSIHVVVMWIVTLSVPVVVWHIVSGGINEAVDCDASADGQRQHDGVEPFRRVGDVSASIHGNVAKQVVGVLLYGVIGCIYSSDSKASSDGNFVRKQVPLATAPPAIEANRDQLGVFKACQGPTIHVRSSMIGNFVGQLIVDNQVVGAAADVAVISASNDWSVDAEDSFMGLNLRSAA